MFVSLLIAAVVGYLLGALPVGYLVARAKGVDIFEVGSKNPGATNVRRVLGHGPGNLVLVLDAAKGALAVALAYLHLKSGGENSSVWFEYMTTPAELGRPIVGLIAAILGHSFSCFTGFRGGKSVATEKCDATYYDCEGKEGKSTMQYSKDVPALYCFKGSDMTKGGLVCMEAGGSKTCLVEFKMEGAEPKHKLTEVK